MLPKREGGMRLRPALDWALAALALAAGWLAGGGRGLLLGSSVVVFWLLLQFSRSLRVLHAAAARPVGTVDSAVMLHARLRPGMTLPQILRLTGSLGERVPPAAGADEAWRWRDAGGASLTALLRGGRLQAGLLQRDAAGT